MTGWRVSPRAHHLQFLAPTALFSFQSCWLPRRPTPVSRRLGQHLALGVERQLRSQGAPGDMCRGGNEGSKEDGEPRGEEMKKPQDQGYRRGGGSLPAERETPGEEN